MDESEREGMEMEITKEETKKEILDALRGKLLIAEDSLYRAESAFKGRSSKQMQEHYGESGKTRNEIVRGYRESVSRYRRLINCVEESF